MSYETDPLKVLRQAHDTARALQVVGMHDVAFVIRQTIELARAQELTLSELRWKIETDALGAV